MRKSLYEFSELPNCLHQLVEGELSIFDGLAHAVFHYSPLKHLQPGGPGVFHEGTLV